jgi:hypothetical protein
MRIYVHNFGDCAFGKGTFTKSPNSGRTSPRQRAASLDSESDLEQKMNPGTERIPQRGTCAAD